MNTTIKKIRLTRGYKRQKHFVLFDCGPCFTKRYMVMGLTTKLFKYTKYFDSQQCAIEYYFKMMSKFKNYKETIGEWKSRGDL